jgi:hypothetical protein
MKAFVINVLSYNLFRNKLKSGRNKRAFIEVLFVSFSSIQLKYTVKTVIRNFHKTYTDDFL